MSDSDSEDLYELLEVKRQATTEDIKKKRRELSIKYHPDKQSDDKKEWGEQMCKKINDACEALCNPERRKMYDKYGSTGLTLPVGFGEPGWSPMDAINGVTNRPKQQHVAPIKIKVSMTLDDIFNGKVVIQNVDRLCLCKQCNNTGYVDKQKRSHKSYVDVSNKCKMCYGHGLVRESYPATFNIGPGVTSKDVVEILNEGHELPKEVQNRVTKRGEIHCSITEIPHPTFKRGVEQNGHINLAHISTTIQLELHEALCGFTRQIKYLDGSILYIDQYDPLMDGDIRVIENKVLPDRGNQYKSGNLYINFKVKFPTTISTDTKSKLYRLLTGTTFNSKKIHTLPTNVLTSELKKEHECAPSIDIQFDDESEQDSEPKCQMQ